MIKYPSIKTIFFTKEYTIPTFFKKTVIFLFLYTFIIVIKNCWCNVLGVVLAIATLIIYQLSQSTDLFEITNFILLSYTLIFPFIFSLEEVSHGGVCIGKGEGKRLKKLLISFFGFPNFPIIIASIGISYETKEFSKADIFEVLSGGPTFTIIAIIIILIILNLKNFFIFLLIPILSLTSFSMLENLGIKSDGAKMIEIYKSVGSDKLFPLRHIIKSNFFILKGFFTIRYQGPNK